MQDVHVYGRQLINAKRNKDALEIFKMNAEKHPKQFTTLMGLARGYSANGDYRTALKYAQQAQPLAPDQLNKTSVETVITKLKEGKDIN
jgi:tetratricopeptide (TPR) repeat protein